MSNYSLIAFNKKEKNNIAQLHLEKFVERDKPFYILSEKDVEFLPIRDNYRFGLIDNTGNYCWFFNGAAIVSDRAQAIEAFNALLDYCTTEKLGTPFAYKEYEKRE